MCVVAGVRVEGNEVQRADGDGEVLQCHCSCNQVSDIPEIRTSRTREYLVEAEGFGEAERLDVSSASASSGRVQKSDKSFWHGGARVEKEVTDPGPDEEDLFE